MPENPPKIFALLAGVNRYKREAGFTKPKDLSGCERDVELITELLGAFDQKRTINIKKLLNEEASYQAVVEHFRDHFGKAKAGDTALFYYSGHGTREKNIPAVFQQYFHADSAEGLVCYDGCTQEGFILSDKELAVLISEIPRDVHVVIVLDSCHSGSGTRENDVRMTDPFDKNRSLDQYLDGWFSEQLREHGEIRLPQREHLLLAAADRSQKAREREFDGEVAGAFTHYLCKAARDKSLNYRQLINRVANSLRANRFQQQAQLEPVGGASVYDRFLLGEKSQSQRYARIYWKAGYRMRPGSWRLEQGAVHGLSVDSIRNVRIPIYAESGNLLGFGKIEELGLQESLFRPAPELELDKTCEYKSEAMGATLLISIEDDDREDLFSALGGNFQLPPGIEFVKPGALYSLKKEGDFWAICDAANELELCAIKGEGSAVFAFNQLQNIARYESLLTMQSPATTQFSPSKLSITIEGLEGAFSQDEEGVYHCCVAADGSGDISYKIIAEHRFDKEVYTALLSLDPDFSINELNLDADLRQPNRKINLYHASLGSLAHAPKIIETHFVLIASLAPVKSGSFVQAGIPLPGLWGRIDLDATESKEHREGALRIRSFGFGSGAQSAESWAVKRITVRIEKGPRLRSD
jgi:hypothetical protein